MTRLNQKTFKEALKGSGGNQSRIAKKLGAGRSTVSMFLKKNPKMKDLLDQEAEIVIDFSEDNIDTDIMIHRSIESSKWKLINSKRGKARGYGMKQEFDIKDDRTRIIIERADDANNKVETKPKAGADGTT